MARGTDSLATTSLEEAQGGDRDGENVDPELEKEPRVGSDSMIEASIVDLFATIDALNATTDTS